MSISSNYSIVDGYVVPCHHTPSYTFESCHIPSNAVERRQTPVERLQMLLNAVVGLLVTALVENDGASCVFECVWGLFYLTRMYDQFFIMVKAHISM